MNGEELYKLLGDLDEDYINEARLVSRKKEWPKPSKKSVLVACLCLLIAVSLFFPSLPLKQYQRISLSNDGVLGDGMPDYLRDDTTVVNNAEGNFPTKLPIYKISEYMIPEDQFQQMLLQLNWEDDPDYQFDYFTLKGNHVDCELRTVTNSSHGFYDDLDLTDAELEAIAWDIFRKIPFLDGEWEYIGISETFTRNTYKGDQQARVGVSFCRVLDGCRVAGNENCTLYFDGGGLVGIRIDLFQYEKIGTMDLVDLEKAVGRIKTPDAFIMDVPEDAKANTVDTLSVDAIGIRLVNQYVSGCKILQPLYVFAGCATLTDGSQVEFQARVIAIPKRYTHNAWFKSKKQAALFASAALLYPFFREFPR